MSQRPPISRRVVLKSLSATVALPWLESSRVFADNADSDIDSDAPPKRFAFLFFGDGIHPPEWYASGSGRGFTLGPAFESLEEVKSKVNVIDGLKHPGGVVGGHARGAAGILSGVGPKNGREIRAAETMDQLLAKRLGDQTALPSLVLACERPVSGFHESGNSMMYASHVSWSSPVSPVPAELYPSLAFDSLFGSAGGAARLSVLDHVSEQLKGVTKQVSRADRERIDEYANSIREVEQRLARMQNRSREEQADSGIEVDVTRPADGLPNQVDEHSKLMCDVIALAFQTDRTRIATLLLTNNLSGQTYPFLGLRRDHHSFSHGWQKPEFAAITKFWVGQYAYFVKKLDSIREGDGTVLDNSCIVLANEQWTAHSDKKIPLVTAGGLSGTLATGRALHYEQADRREMCGFHLGLMDRLGITLDSFGNAHERLAGL